MALRVWLPLNGNLNNQGLSDLTFSNTNTTNLTIDALGKIGSCYQRATKQTAGYITSNKTILLDNDITMCCWALVLDGIASANGLITNHNHSTNTGVGLTFKYISGTDFRISCNTGTGSGRTYDTYYGTTNIKDAWHHLALTYNNTTHQLLLYVDGVVEYTLNNYTNASQEDWIRLFEWSTNYDNNNYRPAVKLNDVRIYDECLSQKQIKEISKGLVVHYKLDNQFRSNRNITLGYYGTVTNGGWGAHRGTATYTEEENNSGLPFKEVTKFVVTYDTSLGSGGGTSVYPTTTYSVDGNTQYTYSVYIKSEDDLAYVHGNFLYRYEYDANGTKLTEGGVCSRERLQKLNNGWYRIWGTFTTQEDTVRLTLPFYTYCGKNNVYYLGGQQLEPGDAMTPYIDNTYNLSEDEPDCNGNQYNGTVFGTLNYNIDSARYSGSTTFASAHINSSAGVVLSNSGDFTINGWFYHTSGTTYYASVESYNTSVCLESSRFFVYPATGSAFVGNWSATNNVWQMLTLVHDSVAKTLTLYVDGVQRAQVATDGTIYPNNTLNIGGRQAGAEYSGSMSDFRIYATALSAEDIKELYQTSAWIDNKQNIMAYEFKEV